MGCHIVALGYSMLPVAAKLILRIAIAVFQGSAQGIINMWKINANYLNPNQLVF